MLESIRWHGSASFAILNGKHIYINPRGITRPDRPADIILIGSGHYDHCSAADIDKLRGEETIMVASPSASTIIGADVVLRPWQSTAVGSACVKGIPILGADGKPEASGDLGFIISTSRYDIYYTGKSASIPDSCSLHPDIVILPIGDNNTAQRAEGIRMMRPRWIVPFGVSSIGKSGRVEAQAFASSVADISEALVLDPTP